MRHYGLFWGEFGADLVGVKYCSHTCCFTRGCRSGGPVPTQSWGAGHLTAGYDAVLDANTYSNPICIPHVFMYGS